MTFRQTVKRFFEPVRENPVMWLKAIRQYFLFSIWPVISILFLRHIIHTIEQWDKNSFIISVTWFGVVTILYYLLRILFRNWWRVPVFAKSEQQVYRKYIPWFISLDNTRIEKIGTGRMVSIVQQWFTTRIDLISIIFRRWMDIVVGICLVLYVLYTTQSSLIIYFLIVFGLVQFIVYKLNLIILENKRLWNPLRNEYTRSIVRILMSKFEIMQQNKASIEVQKLDYNREEFYQLTKKRSLHIEGNYLIPNALVFGLYIVLFLVIWYGIFDGIYSFADFVLFSSTLALLEWTLDTASTSIKDFFQDYSQVEHLWETFDSIPQTSYTQWKDFSYQGKSIELVKIWFLYTSDNDIFKDFSLELKWWTKTAFVGESWWGKTTLIKLLAGYLRPDSGEIIIDGQKLSEVKLTDYYRHIGYLTQEPSVFDGTIYENLTYALENEKIAIDKDKEKKIHEIIRLSKCEFIYEFEYGLQTEIGERGVRLSGWQKQRLAIAKIMLKNPNIILLDEPTSALDSFNEELVSEALNNLFKWKTVIVVAHRLQTVKNADRILYIEWWKVIEDGTHTSLIKKNGKYKKMLDLQSWF